MSVVFVKLPALKRAAVNKLLNPGIFQDALESTSRYFLGLMSTNRDGVIEIGMYEFVVSTFSFALFDCPSMFLKNFIKLVIFHKRNRWS